MKEDPSSPFRSLVPPGPPAGLREAALAGGKAAFGTAPAPDRWTRLVHSRAARAAWAASVLLLLGLHLVLGESPASVPPPAADLDPDDADARAVLHLPRVSERAIDARFGGAS